MGKVRQADTGSPAVEKFFEERGYKGASYVVKDANAKNRPSVWSTVREPASQKSTNPPKPSRSK